MAYEWLDTIDFPSGPGGLGADPYAPWVHPVTKAVYMWDYGKNSWLLFSNSGARLYSMTVDPALDGVTLYDGDLWWDQRALELRVYHRPTPGTSGQTVTGRWVSSTNPQMSLVDLNRNLVIGNLLLDAPTGEVYEEREVMFSVSRPTGGAPEEMLQYEWRVNPPSLSYGGEEYSVLVSNPDSATTTMIWEEGTHVDDGGIIPFQVYCRVSAKPEYEEGFVNPSARTESVLVYPKKKIVDPLDYFIIENRSDDMFLNSGSYVVTPEGNGNFTIDPPFSGTAFFVTLTDDVIATYGLDFAFTLTDPLDGDVDPSDVVGSGYMDSMGDINGIDGDVSGFTIDLAEHDLSVDRYIYISTSSDESFKAILKVNKK